METIITSLIEELFTGLQEAAGDFYEKPSEFPAFEEKVSSLVARTAAGFIGRVLTDYDRSIRDSGLRSARGLTVIRSRERTLCSSIGSITFSRTLYRDREGRTRVLLDEILRLPDHERFTSLAEAELLKEAQTHSYQHAADSLSIHGQAVTRTAVMNKVHGIGEEIPDLQPVEADKRKKCEYLFIEADEDHIHSQKDPDAHGYIGRLAYIFEGKEDLCDGRRKLISPHYFGGVCGGTDGNAGFWKGIDRYILDHYDIDTLKQVYISGDGGQWIRAGESLITCGRFVLDKFHVMKYIYRVGNCAGEDRDEVIGQIYRHIHKNERKSVSRLLGRIRREHPESADAVEACRSFLTGNWDAVQRAFHDEKVPGCSAEGHVSHVFSERLSSRPMGWSETGSDRMCRLRCFVRNYGEDRLLDLVRFRREKAMKEDLEATGTDGIVEDVCAKRYTKKQREDFTYIERIQANLMGDFKARKAIAIRRRIMDL